MTPSNGIAANLMEPDAVQRSVRAGTSRAPAARSPDRPARTIEGEDAVAVGQDFENLLRQVAGLRDPDVYAADFTRQVAQANRRAAANQRITEDDLRVPDEKQRSSERRGLSRQDPSRASAVAIQRGELGKGELGHLYRPLSAAGAGPRGGVAAGSSFNEDLANLRGPSRQSTEAGGRAPRGIVDPIDSEKSQAGQKTAEALGALAKASGVADARASAPALAEAAARSSVRRANAPSSNQNTPGSQRSARPVPLPARQSIVQQSREPGSQSQTRQESDLDARDMKKPFEVQSRTDSASKAKHAEPLSREMRQETLNDVQRVVLANRNERHSLVRMQLSPPEMGKLTIEMKMENNILRIRFEAERPEVGEMLKSNSAALSKALAEQGISVERYEVVLSESANESDNFGNHLDAHGGLHDSSSDPDARAAADGDEERTRIESEEVQAEEEVAPADGAKRRLDIKA
ncbi:MAG: flagellar hook-length control protein FliK [Planctomycetes bacterium]|nr:flagellar hook-length control protein FliK [Planctomycetota bacterium]